LVIAGSAALFEFIKDTEANAPGLPLQLSPATTTTITTTIITTATTTIITIITTIIARLDVRRHRRVVPQSGLPKSCPSYLITFFSLAPSHSHRITYGQFLDHIRWVFAKRAFALLGVRLLMANANLTDPHHYGATHGYQNPVYFLLLCPATLSMLAAFQTLLPANSAKAGTIKVAIVVKYWTCNIRRGAQRTEGRPTLRHSSAWAFPTPSESGSGACAT
jgi:hypothetical protein